MRFTKSFIGKPIINTASYIKSTINSIKGAARSILYTFVSKPTLPSVDVDAKINIITTPRYNTRTVKENMVYYKNAVARSLLQEAKENLGLVGKDIIILLSNLFKIVLFVEANYYLVDIVSFAFITNQNVVDLLKFHIYQRIGSLKMIFGGLFTKVVLKYGFNKVMSLNTFINYTSIGVVSIFSTVTLYNAYESALEFITTSLHLGGCINKIVKNSFRSLYLISSLFTY